MDQLSFVNDGYKHGNITYYFMSSVLISVSFVFQVESLYPSEFGPDSMTAEVFLGSAISQLDKSIEERVTAASSKGNVLRYVCVIEKSRYLFIIIWPLVVIGK